MQLLCLAMPMLTASWVHGFHPRPTQVTIATRTCDKAFKLMADERRKPSDGYYARPSAALEQGGGFYVPGFEGSKLRLASAILLSISLVLNRLLSPGESPPSMMGSEALGVVGIALLFAQVAAQASEERKRESVALRAAIVARVKERTEISSELQPDCAEAAAWVGETLLRLTPAIGVVWLIEAPSVDNNSRGGAGGSR